MGDAELYAVQALSRTNPGLAHDVFLSDASQDHYTIFSPIYAFFIKRLGLQEAAISLLVLFKVCFYVPAGMLSRKALRCAYGAADDRAAHRRARRIRERFSVLFACRRTC